jgi:hypothetical protein
MKRDPAISNECLNMRDLKRFAGEKLSSKPLLREIILSEKDQLEPSEFLAKMEVWLRLFSSEARA